MNHFTQQNLNQVGSQIQQQTNDNWEFFLDNRLMRFIMLIIPVADNGEFKEQLKTLLLH